MIPTVALTFLTKASFLFKKDFNTMCGKRKSPKGNHQNISNCIRLMELCVIFFLSTCEYFFKFSVMYAYLFIILHFIHSTFLKKQFTDDLNQC